MKKIFLSLIFLGLALLVFAQATEDELPILNLQSGVKEFATDLYGGATVYLLVQKGATQEIITKYVIPKKSNEAGYKFNVDVGTTTLYAVFHGKIRLK